MGPTEKRTFRAAGLTLALFGAIPLVCHGQDAAAAPAPAAETIPAPPAPSVYSNPRAAADDPRIGLKPGLYDAGEAASGLQRIATLPKPSGFAPGDFIPTPT